ncbi:aldehyde dehydrogenase [Priestia megaterium]|uniref:aldehyde dehydrogenase family protein n=1 Tax=Priestia megaterium TaxID=1404 RepID=UPI000BF49EC9|nr:aldehyde dehydrogenase family protein [Priestia megaterium]PES95260.1 aldehyde dehydrogenase [Priestia megaterium]
MVQQTCEKVYDLNSVVNGQLVKGTKTVKVLNKFNNEVIATVSFVNKESVNNAIDVALEKFKSDKLSKYERYTILRKASDLIQERKEELAQDLSREVGKTIKESRVEIDRAVQTMLLSAEEAKNLAGEQIPIDATPNNDKKVAYYVRAPLGVICAITPFNVPFNLSCHKIGPAIAAGNTVVWKPATDTPITAFKLLEILREAGLPDGYVNLLFGSGREMGEYFTKNNKIAKFTFTGSPAVGRWLKENSGLRNVSLELGNNSPNIVHFDADIDLAAKSCVKWGFANAGQTCISVQRVYVHKDILKSFKEKLIQYTSELKVGDPLDENTDMGPMINPREIDRVESWINEAKANGANVFYGGQRDRNILYPTLIENVNSSMKLVCEEIFGPVITLMEYEKLDEVIELANDSDYGLQSAIFTKNINTALYAAEKITSGGIVINDGSTYRADLMPYGGIKNSGIGKEGPKYSIQEMTYIKPIIIHLDNKVN